MKKDGATGFDVIDDDLNEKTKMFVGDHIRDAEERGYFGALSTSQWISIFVFALSAFMVTKIILKRKRSDML